MIRAILPLMLAASGGGNVVEVTPGRAYLDRGAEDGLTAGMMLELVRGARRVGTCRVENLAPHHATCTGAAAREGDSFVLAVARSPGPKAAALPPLPAAQELLDRGAAVRTAPAPAVVDRAGSFVRGLGRPLLEASVGHASYTAVDAADGTFHQERLALALRGVETFPGFRFHGDLAAIGYVRPEGLTTFQPSTTARLFVYEAQLTNRDDPDPLVLSLGRVWPWHAPGVSVFDGAQAGTRLSGGALEIGAYGGGLPLPDTLEPTLQSWTGGVYFMGERRGQEGAFSWMRFTARAGAVRVAGVGTRGEAELATLLVPLRRVDLSAAVRFQAGDGISTPQIGFWRVELGMRPVDALRISGGLRFLDRQAALVQLAQVTGSAGAVSTTRHADLALAYDLASWITVGASGGVAQDVTTRWVRRWVGPELTFPRALGSRGSLGLGYQEELGSAAGRSAWTQIQLQPAQILSLYGRLSYFEDRSQTAGAATIREAGMSTGGALQLGEKLQLTAALLFRPAIPAALDSESVQLPLGIFGDVVLRGQF